MQSTQSCLLELEALTGETSGDKRRKVLKRVTDLFFLTSGQQTPNDVTVFGSVMERIAYELEVEARAELSERISESDKAPRRLVCRLATDEIAVARPVLERSRVLTDEDLIQIAKTRGQPHLQAISKRPELAAPVTDVIVERGEAPVLLQVTANQGAEFSRGGLGVLAEKAWSDGELLTALGSRADLPPELMDEIKLRVATKIKTEMAGKYTDADMADVDNLVDQSAASLDIEGVRKSNDELQERALNQQLSEEDIIGFAKARRLTETVHALSVLTGLDDRMVSHCLLKADIAALGIISKANNFRSTTYLTLIQTRIGQEGIAARDVARAMREYEALSIKNAKRTLRFLKMRCKVSLEQGRASDPGDANLWQAHNSLPPDRQLHD